MSFKKIVIICLAFVLFVAHSAIAVEQQLKFNDYSCKSPLSTLGGICASCGSYKGANYIRSVQNRCIHVPKKLTSAPKLPSSCKPATFTMFFSWVAYEHNPSAMLGRVFNTAVDSRLNGCTGDFVIRNEFHHEGLDFNQHLSVVVNEKLGVVIIAFRGTEFDPKRLEQTIIDWVKGNFDARFVNCPWGSCGRIHAGFYGGYALTGEFLKAQVKQYSDAGYKIYITGHSQGAAVATVASVHLKRTYPSVPMTTITFASPRVGDQAFVDAFNSLPKFENGGRYISRHDALILDTTDIVTTVPPVFPLPYRHVPREIIIECKTKFFGNPKPIPGINFKGPSLVPKAVGCHYQQVYMDGLLGR